MVSSQNALSPLNILPDVVPCSEKGASYGNCRPSVPVTPPAYSPVSSPPSLPLSTPPDPPYPPSPSQPSSLPPTISTPSPVPALSNTSAPPRPLKPTPPSSRSKSGSAPLVAGIVAATVVLLFLSAVLFIFWKRKKCSLQSQIEGEPNVEQQTQQNKVTPPMDPVVNSPPPPPATPQYHLSHESNITGASSSNSSAPPTITIGPSKSNFTYEQLWVATNGFSVDNLIGEGGFGYVYKGVLPDSKEVAVKKLKANSGQGDREFLAEVEIISRVHHRHLVSLVGYCIAGDQRLLVYKFVPNKALEYHLHGIDRPTMEWSTRMKVALGSAKGLAYLHEDCNPKIIHRDIKAANILLDYNFEAQVADFGLAKFFSDDYTHVTTRVMGTFGYLSPEYAASGKLTDKSDVYSFGVMLLELITGRRPAEKVNLLLDDTLVEWAKPVLAKAMASNEYDDLVDHRLQKNYDAREMGRMFACAAACVRQSARLRPRMSQIVRILEGGISIEDLNQGLTPGHSSVYGSHDAQNNIDMENVKNACSSQEYTSSATGPITGGSGQTLTGSSNLSSSTES